MYKSVQKRLQGFRARDSAVRTLLGLLVDF